MASLRTTLVALLAVLCGVSARPKTNKDWGKMNDKDWDKVFEEWEDEDEREEYAYKPPKPAGGGIEMLATIRIAREVRVTAACGLKETSASEVKSNMWIRFAEIPPRAAHPL